MNRLSEMFNVNHFIVSQVNPHVLPFLSKEECPRRETQQDWSPKMGWLSTITHLAKDEVLYRMTVFSELGIFPTFLTKAVSIMNQKYFGDITIFPEIPYTSFPLMLKNPTTDFILKACLGGEQATWPKLGRIRNHLAIELALDSAIQKMRARVAFCPTEANLMRNSILVYRPVPAVDVGGGRGRSFQRRRGSLSRERRYRKGNAGQSGSCPAHKPRITRKHSPFEHLGPSIFLDHPSTEIWENEHRFIKLQNSIQQAYIKDNQTVVESDDSDKPEPHPPRRPKALAHRASWSPSSHDYAIEWPGRHNCLRAGSRKPSSLSLGPFHSSSTDMIGSHSVESPGAPGNPSPSWCGALKMTTAEDASI